MKKILNIGGNDVAFECNAVTPFYYKQQFGREFYSDLLKMAKGISGINDFDKASWDDMEHLDFSVISNFAWACAKTADEKINTPLEWLKENKEFDVLSDGIEIAELVMNNIQTKKK